MLEVKCENSKMLINARHIKWVDYTDQILLVYIDDKLLEFSDETLKETTTSDLYQQIKLRLITVNK
ncbi:hypothetical protein [Cyanobacterium aponinum]|uniref:hypothetical protein n=1 Tax=Cyanobacterium aponinum TaxID=379064 RepID=UPI000C12D7B0|nr:hypothetical protein [Cyanobacterium aponinum]PHV63200.1 hypothetical protein CSQ80_06605 [Cyanobacterium aponinum IPPAS B-1201]